jgi:hypothetical protein
LEKNEAGKCQFIRKHWETISREALVFTQRLLGPAARRPDAHEALDFVWVSGRSTRTLLMIPGTSSRDLDSGEKKKRLMREKTEVILTPARLTAKPAPFAHEDTDKGNIAEVIRIPRQHKKQKVDASPKPGVTRTPKPKRRAVSVDQTITLQLI